MFLLIQNPEVNSSYYFTYFTFHNVSINTENPDVSGVDFQNFTFHDISINTVYQIEKGNTFAWDEYEAIGDIYFIKDGDSYFENGVLNREKFGTGGEMFF